MLSRKLCQLLQVFRIGLGSSILKVKLIEPLCNCIEVLVYLLSGTCSWKLVRSILQQA